MQEARSGYLEIQEASSGYQEVQVVKQWVSEGAGGKLKVGIWRCRREAVGI